MGGKESDRRIEYLKGGLPRRPQTPPVPKTPAEVFAEVEKRAWRQGPILVYNFAALMELPKPSTKPKELPISGKRLQKEAIIWRVKKLSVERKHDIALELELAVVEEIFGNENDIFDKKRREKLSGVSSIKRALIFEVNYQGKSYAELLDVYKQRYKLPDTITETDLQEIHDEAIIFYGYKFDLLDTEKLQ